MHCTAARGGFFFWPLAGRLATLTVGQSRLPAGRDPRYSPPTHRSEFAHSVLHSYLGRRELRHVPAHAGRGETMERSRSRSLDSRSSRLRSWPRRRSSPPAAVRRFWPRHVRAQGGNMVPAEFDGLEDQRVVVVCRPPSSNEYRHAGASRAIVATSQRTAGRQREEHRRREPARRRQLARRKRLGRLQGTRQGRQRRQGRLHRTERLRAVTRARRSTRARPTCRSRSTT